MEINIVTFIIFIFLYSFVSNEIIKMNVRLKKLKNITTKLGVIKIEYIEPSIDYIDYETLDPYFYLSLRDDAGKPLSYDCFYRFKNVLNANSYRTSVSSYSIDNNTITVKANPFILSKNFICELLYRTKYIDKYIYSLDNNNFIYFGGTPEYLINNHINYTFGNKPFQNTFFESIISNINIEINDKYRFKLDLYDKLLFSYDIDCPGIICLQSKDFNLFKEQLNNFIKNNIMEFMNISSISFKIGDKIANITLDRSPYEYIVEGYTFSLGKKFLTIFDYREYNLENGNVNFYLDKNKTKLLRIYKEKIGDKKIIKYNSCSYIDYSLFFIFLFITIFTFLKTYDRNKNFYTNYLISSDA